MGRVTHLASLARVIGASLAGAPGTPVTARALIRPVLRRNFGPLELQEWWDGEDARYARLTASGGQALFVKYRPALDFRERPYRRFRNEELYLRDYAPHVPIAHARLLHAAASDASRKAHVVLEDLAPTTREWLDLSEAERHARLPNVMTLIATFHAAWLSHPLLAQHPSQPWSAEYWAARAQRHFARTPECELPHEVLSAARALSGDSTLTARIAQAQRLTMTHGDLHFQQFLFDREDPQRLYLIDYQHTRVAPLGADLAHLLAVRFSWFERRALERELLGAYQGALRDHGVLLDRAELLREYRVGLLLNFLSMWERLGREPEPLFRDLLLRTHAALREHWPEVLEP